MDMQKELAQCQKTNAFLLQIIQSAKIKEQMYLMSFSEQSLKPYEMLCAR